MATRSPNSSRRRTSDCVTPSSFGAAAVAYAEHRPDYAQDAVRWALGPAPGRRVVDLGAGTGKLTAALVAAGTEVIAVEPDPGMQSELRRSLPDVRSLPGSAEAIPLPDASVDAVLAGNAMHWFDMAVAGPEIARVLVPGGILAGLWNVMDDRVEWVAGLERISGERGHRPARHAQQLARRDGDHAPSEDWRGRPVRFTGAGRVPARAAPHRRLPGRDTRDARRDVGHARTGTTGHSRPDPRFPREQTGDRPRRVHAPDAHRCAARPAAVKAVVRPMSVEARRGPSTGVRAVLDRAPAGRPHQHGSGV